MRLATALLAVAIALSSRADANPKKLGQAFRALEEGDYETAVKLGEKLVDTRLENADYAHYVLAQAAAAVGNDALALKHFEKLKSIKDSRFSRIAAWRAADTLFRLKKVEAARAAYWDLVNKAGRGNDNDLGLARFRIAAADRQAGNNDKATEEFVRFLLLHPGHPLEAQAFAELRGIKGADFELSIEQRMARADELSKDKYWHEAEAELAELPATMSADEQTRRDFILGMTFFRMRRHYASAADILLAVSKTKSPDASEALFHGARAHSRADQDEAAFAGYQQVVKEYPKASWAAEAAFLSGWVWFNRGQFERGLPLIQEARKKYPKSEFAVDCLWYEAFSYFLLGRYQEALPLFGQVASKSGDLVPDKGRYWRARTLFLLGKKEEANIEYKRLSGTFPLTWYALLAQARLREQKIDVKPFGDSPRAAKDVPALGGKESKKLTTDPLLRSADELLAAGLAEEAGVELTRGESSFVKRHPRPIALAALLERYRNAKNFNRPWMLALVQGGDRALDAPPSGIARTWWQHAYPLAYRPFVEKWRHLGDSPQYYLYTIMHKESGFDPHTHSYADAQGLLQMIPPTTQRVARELDIGYSADLLFDPEQNIRTGSWYIGRLLQKFKGQIPVGAGAFNSGPSPVMRWLEENGKRPMDEFIELVPYTQTRNYMRRVPGIYAHYLYLYEQKLYEQSLTVDPNYVRDNVTY